MARTRSFKFPNSFGDLDLLFDKLQRALSSLILTTGGLAIKAGGSTLAKTANTVYFTVDGKLYSKTASDMAALDGTVTNAKFNVFVFSVATDGTLKTSMGTESATQAGVVFPTISDGEAIIGFVIINPTGTGNFVGGTTALDDATVTPNAVYVDTVGVFLPGIQNI